MTKSVKNAEVALKSIMQNKLNPRKTFDKDNLAELTASIKQLGVLQPVVVRPKGTKYEMVAGERRYRAAKAAGLVTLPARVVEMTDQEVLEAAIVENEQREDVSDFEKADGYAQLIDEHKVKIEDVAKRVGKSVSTIRALLKLRQVPIEGRKGHAQGILSTAVCQLIAARPNELMRARCCQQALTKQTHWGQPSKDGDYPSFRQLKEWIEQHCMIELKQAPFDPKDEQLWPTAGSCEKCPKRTGNNRADFPEGRADVCTDPNCFQEKSKRHKEQALKKAKDAGYKIINDGRVRELFYYDGVLMDTHYYDVAKQCPADKRKGKRPRSYKQLLDGHVEPGELEACLDQKGKMHVIVERKLADSILSKQHGLKNVDQSRGLSAQESAYQKKQKEAERKRKEENRKLVDEAMSRLVATTKPVNVPKQTEQVLRRTVMEMFAAAWADVKREIYRGRGIAGGDNKQKQATVQSQVDSANCHELIGWLGELLAIRLSVGYDRKPVDLKSLFTEKGESK